jgi:hypothetical protein
MHGALGDLLEVIILDEVGDVGGLDLLALPGVLAVAKVGAAGTGGMPVVGVVVGVQGEVVAEKDVGDRGHEVCSWICWLMASRARRQSSR